MLRALRPFLGVLFLLATIPVLGGEEKSDFFFRPKDRIVFLGDSITEQYQYSSDIELYLTTRFPDWNLTFINAGISGDTAGGGANRFNLHVLAEKPTAVTINFGMNDGGYGAFNPGASAQFAKNTEAMLKAAQKAGVRVAVLSPNAVDRRVQERFKLYLETQKQFYAPLKEVAAANQAVFVDQYAITRAAIEKMEADGAKQVVPFGDGFHTSPPGGLFMAHAILTGLHAPAVVSRVDIDVSAEKAKTERCKVDKLAMTKEGVSFERFDESLPMPVQKDWLSLLPYVNQLADLNDYGLKVTGLQAGKYRLSIDGAPVGTYAAEELGRGVNLGLLTDGPIHAQGQKVFVAINAKNQLVHQRFRGVVMFQAPDWLADVSAERRPAELARRTEQIAVRQAEIYELARPVPHRFELKVAP